MTRQSKIAAAFVLAAAFLGAATLKPRDPGVSKAATFERGPQNDGNKGGKGR